MVTVKCGGFKIFIDFLLWLLLIFLHTHLQTQTKPTSLSRKPVLAMFAVSIGLITDLIS